MSYSIDTLILCMYLEIHTYCIGIKINSIKRLLLSLDMHILFVPIKARKCAASLFFDKISVMTGYI